MLGKLRGRRTTTLHWTTPGPFVAAFLLAAPLLIAAGGPAAASGGANVSSVLDLVVWPNPDDDAGAPSTTTITFTLAEDGHYLLWVTSGRGIYTEQDLGQVTGSGATRTWTWNGRVDGREPAPRGTYRIDVMREAGSTGGYDRLARSAEIEVHNGTETRWVRDQRRERTTGRVDLSWVGLTSSPDSVIARWEFRTRARRDLYVLEAGLDVSNAKRATCSISPAEPTARSNHNSRWHTWAPIRGTGNRSGADTSTWWSRRAR